MNSSDEMAKPSAELGELETDIPLDNDVPYSPPQAPTTIAVSSPTSCVNFKFGARCVLKQQLTDRLSRKSKLINTVFTVVCAFSAYFSIYGISVSLFAASFTGKAIFGSLNLKVAFSIAQLIGYALSKVAASILIPGLSRGVRCTVLTSCALSAVAPLILFGVLPPGGQTVMVFLSALPQAWLWGLMVLYLEGRTTSDILLMGLYLSVMVASGAAQSIAFALLERGVSENWMPAMCAVGSAIVFLIFINLLDCVPDPTLEDKIVRKERRPMKPAEARKFFIKWAPGLIGVMLVYSLLTGLRNFRSYFATEIWTGLAGPNFNPAIFTESEIAVGVCTAVGYSLLYFMKNDKRAFFAILGAMVFGCVMILFSTLFSSVFGALPFMILLGTGLFLAYIPPGAMLYDRFNSATGVQFSSVFMIYLSDISGYVATLAVLLYHDFGERSTSYLTFFKTIAYVTAVAGGAGVCLSALYFWIALKRVRVVKAITDVEANVDPREPSSN